MRLSIIIPAYNEEKRIAKTLEDYGQFFKDLKKQKKLDFEILVVINNTIDETENIVKKYSKKYKEIRYLNFKQGGKGFAIIEGFKNSSKRKNDLVGFVDADMATSPKAFYDLVKKIHNYDGIIASRNMKSAKVYSHSKFRRIFVSKMFNFFVRTVLLLPYKDTQCGAKIFRRQALTKVIPYFTMSKWAFDVDILYNFKKFGFKIREIPTLWFEKKGSKIDIFGSGIWMALGIMRLRLLNSPFKSMMRIYDKVLKRIWRIK